MQAFDVGPAVGLNEAVYAPFVIKNPRFWSDSTVSIAVYDQLLASLVDPSVPVPNIPGAYTQYTSVPGRSARGGADDPLQSIAIIDGRRNNNGAINTSGMDFTASYSQDTDWGAWHIGGVATWVWNYDLSPLPGATAEKLAGMFTGPLKFSGRAQAGVDWGNLSATLFANFKSAYNIDRKYIPPAAPDQYLSISSHTTLDLSIRYETEATGILNDISFTLGVQNIFNTDPPLVLVNTSPAVHYDPSYASALGREISLSIGKKF